MHHPGSTDALGALQQPRRNHYFYGKLMDAAHFEMEQVYGNRKRWLLNRLVFGTGVLCGLEATAEGDRVCLSPGVAIDNLGREIIVPGPDSVCIDPWQLTDDRGRPASTLVRETYSGNVFICASYRECAADFMPVLVTDCDTDEQCAPGTIVEAYHLVVTTDKPAPLGKLPREEVCELLLKGPSPDALRARLSEIYAKDRPAPHGDTCVPLALIELKGGKIASVQPSEYRPDIYTNPRLFELIACLSKRIAAGGTGPQGPAGPPGSKWSSGTTNPSDGTGADGDYYLNTTTGDVFRKTGTAWVLAGNIKGAPGAAGAAGKAGAAWFSGSGAPTAATGADGDYYLNKTNGDVYKKTGSTWTAAGNIRGPQGSPGTPGAGLEAELTRIEALSWRHGSGSNDLAKITGPGDRQAVVIAFTDLVNVAAIDAEHVFQVLVEHDPGLRRRGVVCRCPVLGKVIPVRPTAVDSRGVIKECEEFSDPKHPGFGPAAAFLFDQRTEIGPHVIKRDIDELWVTLRGDFVVDVHDKAIDAEFVRAELRTGDRPAGSDLGIQGGLFESWFRFKADPTK